MAKYRKYIRGAVDETLDLGTLAANTLVSAVFSDTVAEATWCSSLKAKWALSGFTPATDVGPIVVGIAHSDYTDAEIEAWIENTTSWKEFDLVQAEVAKRKVRQVGIFDTPSGTGGPLAIVTLGDDRDIWTKAKWMLGSGQTLRFWAYNGGTAPVSATTPELRVIGHANLWPK